MNIKTVRLDKFISNSGLISRRSTKKLLVDQNVTVNGNRVKEVGTRIDPLNDKVAINGKLIIPNQLVYYLLNKPKGYISTTSDELGRENVTALIDTKLRIYPMGRLDKDTHGLLILTNDGQLTHKLIHPKYHIAKTYKLVLANAPSQRQLRLLSEGVNLDDGRTLPAKVSVEKQSNLKTTLLVTIYEGRNRQIRRMCDALGLNLIDLSRISFGPLALGRLKSGQYRILTKKEVDQLKKATEQKH